MKTMLIDGPWECDPAVLARLLAAGYQLVPLAALREHATPQDAPVLSLIASAAELPAAPVARPWVAWNSTSDPALVSAAYQAGALAVVPAEAGVESLLRTLQQLGGATPHERQSGGVRQYRRGERIAVAEESVIVIQEGVVALVALHDDGAEVLLGMAGPGQLLLDHPEDSCYLQLIAHTAVALEVRPWHVACRSQLFPDQLRARLQQMEAWASMQARPHLDQRVLGILSLLAEQFGSPSEGGTLIGLRITHGQLASAVGATRTTITRILRDLRTRGLLTTIGSGEQERFCLKAAEHHHHHQVRR